ncbi:MAG: hypothetical protein IKU34_08945 [Clostridia bacterium]|nr:hypothetical protein [Clostridia bacterium]
MMDNFKEDIAVNRRPLLNNLLYAMAWVLIVIFGAYALLMLQVVMYAFDVFSLVTTVIAAAVAILLFIYKDNLKLEYEYTFTNGSLDFAKVLRGAKRKELGSMTVANVSACGHVAHDSFQRFLSMKDVKKKNWFLNRDGNLFYFYYVKENEKNMIIIEPSEDMVEMIKRYLPVGVYQG